MNTIGVLDAVWRDLRHAARLLRRNPGFASIAVLSLALGIGANTAIFSLVNAFLLRSLPVRNPEELVLFRAVEGVNGRMSRAGENNGSIDPATGRNSTTSFSLLILDRFRATPSGLSEVFAFAPVSQPNVLIDGQPEIAASAQLVSGNYHAGLGVPARLGRIFTMEDDRRSAQPVAVISFRYWDARFGRDPGVIGKTIAVNRVPTVIVGVTPPGFDGAAQAGESPDISLVLAHHLEYQAEPYRADAALVLVASHHGSRRAGCDAGAGARGARAGLPGSGARRMGRGPGVVTPRPAPCRPIQRWPPTPAPRARTTCDGSMPGRSTS